MLCRLDWERRRTLSSSGEDLLTFHGSSDHCGRDCISPHLFDLSVSFVMGGLRDLGLQLRLKSSGTMSIDFRSGVV